MSSSSVLHTCVRLILLIMKYCVKNCNTMVFGILLWRGSKAILTIGLNLSSLGPIDLIREKFCGVPQGSILGPLLFIIYIDDLPNVSSLTQSLLFADDTSIFCSHKDANHLVSIVNNELAKIVIWLKVNKLSLNLTKTNFMIFHPRQKKVNVNVPLTLENTVIKQVTEMKFLDVLIDQHLSWKPHIDFVWKKFRKVWELSRKPAFAYHPKLWWSCITPLYILS